MGTAVLGAEKRRVTMSNTKLRSTSLASTLSAIAVAVAAAFTLGACSSSPDADKFPTVDSF